MPHLSSAHCSLARFIYISIFCQLQMLQRYRSFLRIKKKKQWLHFIPIHSRHFSTPKFSYQLFAQILHARAVNENSFIPRYWHDVRIFSWLCTNFGFLSSFFSASRPERCCSMWFENLFSVFMRLIHSTCVFYFRFSLFIHTVRVFASFLPRDKVDRSFTEIVIHRWNEWLRRMHVYCGMSFALSSSTLTALIQPDERSKMGRYHINKCAYRVSMGRSGAIEKPYVTNERTHRMSRIKWGISHSRVKRHLLWNGNLIDACEYWLRAVPCETMRAIVHKRQSDSTELPKIAEWNWKIRS